MPISTASVDQGGTERSGSAPAGLADMVLCHMSGRYLWRWLLPLTLLHGLLYLTLVPPWQHYDEPTHFEYVRLVALLERQPALGTVDTATNREIADSMYRFRFWPLGVRPDLLRSQGPDIGITQLVHPPFYYALAAVPVRWLRYLSIETQLYAARLVATGLYVLIVVVAWRISTLLMPDNYLSQVTVPLLIVLTPAFSDMMSAVNNDVLVNFSITTLLLGCILLVRNGLRPVPIILALLSLGVALMSKRTAVVGLVPLSLALLWGWQRRPVRWWFYGLALVGCSVILGVGAFRFVNVPGGVGAPGGIVLRDWLASLDQYYLRMSLARTFTSVLDWERTRDLYPFVSKLLFASFWVRFGWGHVKMGDAWEHTLIGVIMVGSIGLFIQGRRAGPQLLLWQRRCIWLLIAILLTAWGAALMRLHPLPPPDVTWAYRPVGRYIHLAIVPTIWLLVWGFQGLGGQRWHAYSLSVLIGAFLVIDTVAWAYTLINFYYRW